MPAQRFSFSLVVSTAVAVLLLAACGEDSPWAPLDRCVMGVIVDYDAGTTVSTDAQAAEVFAEYIADAAAGETEIFGSPASSWSDPTADPDGTYRGVRYWMITAKRDGVRKNVFDVSEDGKVVRLLGCI